MDALLKNWFKNVGVVEDPKASAFQSTRVDAESVARMIERLFPKATRGEEGEGTRIRVTDPDGGDVTLTVGDPRTALQLSSERAPLLEVPLGSRFVQVKNKNASRYVGKSGAVEFEDVKMLLYQGPLTSKQKSEILRSFDVNCWSRREEAVPIYRRYVVSVLESASFVTAVVSGDRVLGFAALSLYPSVSRFKSTARLSRRSAAIRRKYGVDAKKLSKFIDLRAGNKGGVLYVHLLCSRFRFGSLLLRQLEDPSWAETLGYRAIALRAIESAFSFYSARGYLRTRDNVTFFPAYLTQDGTPIYATTAELPDLEPLEIFENEEEEGYVFFKHLTPSTLPQKTGNTRRPFSA
jgi:hypothetical protein